MAKSVKVLSTTPDPAMELYWGIVGVIYHNRSLLVGQLSRDRLLEIGLKLKEYVASFDPEKPMTDVEERVYEFLFSVTQQYVRTCGKVVGETILSERFRREKIGLNEWLAYSFVIRAPLRDLRTAQNLGIERREIKENLERAVDIAYELLQSQ